MQTHPCRHCSTAQALICGGLSAGKALGCRHVTWPDLLAVRARPPETQVLERRAGARTRAGATACAAVMQAGHSFHLIEWSPHSINVHLAPPWTHHQPTTLGSLETRAQGCSSRRKVAPPTPPQAVAPPSNTHSNINHSISSHNPSHHHPLQPGKAASRPEKKQHQQNHQPQHQHQPPPQTTLTCVGGRGTQTQSGRAGGAGGPHGRRHVRVRGCPRPATHHAPLPPDLHMGPPSHAPDHCGDCVPQMCVEIQ